MKSNEVYKKANELLNQKKFGQALEKFSECIALNTYSFEALLGAADSFKGLGFYDEAIKHYESANKNRKAGNQILIFKGLADSYYKMGNYDKAIKYFDDILQLDSNNKLALTGKATCLFLKNEFHLAIEHFNELIAIEEANLSELNKTKIENEALIKKSEKEIEHIKEKIEGIYAYLNANKEKADIEINKLLVKANARSLSVFNRPYKKIEMPYDEIKDLSKEEVKVLRAQKLKNATKTQVSKVRKKRDKNLVKAIYYCQIALRIDPTNVLALKNISELSMLSGEYDNALRYLKKYLKAEPNHDISNEYLNAMLNYADVDIQAFIDEELYEDAIDLCNLILELDPNYINALDKKVNILMSLDELDEEILDVVEIYNKIISITPNDYKYYIKKANMLHSYIINNQLIDDFDLCKDAIDAYNSALKINSDLKNVQETRNELILLIQDHANLLFDLKFEERANVYFDLAIKGSLDYEEPVVKMQEEPVVEYENISEISTCLIEKREIFEKIRNLHNALILNNNDVDSLYLLAEEYAKIGKFEEVIKCYVDIINIDGNSLNNHDLYDKFIILANRVYKELNTHNLQLFKEFIEKLQIQIELHNVPQSVKVENHNHYEKMEVSTPDTEPFVGEDLIADMSEVTNNAFYVHNPNGVSQKEVVIGEPKIYRQEVVAKSDAKVKSVSENVKYLSNKLRVAEGYYNNLLSDQNFEGKKPEIFKDAVNEYVKLAIKFNKENAFEYSLRAYTNALTYSKLLNELKPGNIINNIIASMLEKEIMKTLHNAADKFKQLGRTLYKEGNFDDAINFFKNTLDAYKQIAIIEPNNKIILDNAAGLLDEIQVKADAMKEDHLYHDAIKYMKLIYKYRANKYMKNEIANLYKAIGAFEKAEAKQNKPVRIREMSFDLVI